MTRRHLHPDSPAMLALLASFGAGHVLDLDAHLTILLYSLTSSATFLLYLWISWAMARQQRVEVGVAAEI